MKALIIYISVHHQNTLKIAKAMAGVLNADLKTAIEAKPEELNNYDLIGFGSGIYIFRHHRKLLRFIDGLNNMNGKKAFIFSTSGAGSEDLERNHRKIKEALADKGLELIGEFNCLGLDTFGPLGLFGGLNKGRPSDQDLDNARNFAKNLLTA